MKKISFMLLLTSGLCADSDTLSSLPCVEGQYQRIQTKECLLLTNKSWGFQRFDIPFKNIYPLVSCTQSALQSLLNSIPKEGGKVLLPACTINISGGINIPSNVILQGKGEGNTVISNKGTSSILILRGRNNIISHLSINGNGTSLNGIAGYYSKGNVLVEFIEAYDFNKDQGSGISFLTDEPLSNSQITVRYCKSSGGLIGIDLKVSGKAHSLLYSNEVFNNTEYGFDLSSNDGVELAGNYMHHNGIAGAKSPIATNILYHHNNINYNLSAGLVYMGSNPSAVISAQKNDLSNNGGLAFASWDANYKNLTIVNNITEGSMNPNGFTIGAIGAKTVNVIGNHKKIWADGTVIQK
jgi:hypothetical protein